MVNNTQTEHLLVGTPFSEGFRVVLVIIGVVMFLSGLFGNGLLVVVMYKSKVKEFPKVFIANLALADLVVVCCLPYLVLDLMLGWHPVVNVTHCRANAAILCIGYSVSITSLITVSFNRYLKICHPLAFRRIFSTTRRNMAICGGLWGFGVVANIPAFFPSVAPYNYDPDCHACNARGDSVTVNYGNVAMILLLIVPIVLIGYFNVAIYRRWHNSRKKMQRSDQKKEKKTEKNAKKSVSGADVEDLGVRSGSSVDPATEVGRKVTAAEPVQDKENLRQRIPSDNDKHTETRSAFELGTVDRQENIDGKSTCRPSLTAYNSTPGLGDMELTPRHTTPSSGLLRDQQTAPTSSGCSETLSTTLLHPNWKAPAAKSEVRGSKDCSDPETGSKITVDAGAENLDSDTVDSDVNAVDSQGSLYPKSSSTNKLYPSNSSSSSVCPNSGSANVYTDSGSKNDAHIHSVSGPPRAKTSVKKKKKVRPEVALVRSLLVISVALFALYTPFSVILVLSFFLKDAVPGQVTVISALLLFANCAINWIIYGVMNTLFQKAYINAMKTLLFCCKSSTRSVSPRG